MWVTEKKIYENCEREEKEEGGREKGLVQCIYYPL